MHIYFSGSPSDLQDVLNGLTIQTVGDNSVGNGTGTVTVTLYDGVGDQCVSIRVLGRGSIRSECFVRSAVFTVTIVQKSAGTSAAGSASPSESSKFNFKYYLIGGIGGGVVLIGVLRCCYLRRLRKQREK